MIDTSFNVSSLNKSSPCTLNDHKKRSLGEKKHCTVVKKKSLEQFFKPL